MKKYLVQFSYTLPEGKIVTDNNLVFAVNFGDAERLIHEEFEGFLNLSVNQIKEVKISDIVYSEEVLEKENVFFEVVVAMVEYNENTGKEKHTPYTVLVEEETVQGASNKAIALFTMSNVFVKSAKLTKITGIVNDDRLKLPEGVTIEVREMGSSDMFSDMFQ